MTVFFCVNSIALRLLFHLICVLEPPLAKTFDSEKIEFPEQSRGWMDMPVLVQDLASNGKVILLHHIHQI